MNPKEKTKFISNWIKSYAEGMPSKAESLVCLLYTSDAADE